MSRYRLHQLLVGIVVAMFVISIALYVTSIVRAPEGRGTAGLFDGWSMWFGIAGVAVGIVDFFVRPLGGRSGDADVMAEAERARTGSVRTTQH